jgi:hypothetical protein
MFIAAAAAAATGNSSRQRQHTAGFQFLCLYVFFVFFSSSSSSGQQQQTAAAHSKEVHSRFSVLEDTNRSRSEDFIHRIQQKQKELMRTEKNGSNGSE